MADDAPEIEGTDLAALIASELSAAKRYTDEELSDKRATNIEYYQGVMRDTPAAPNRSAVISRDVTDTISWMLPGIIRVFTASDNMALYEPQTERDREFAQQASDYTNYVFFRRNDGYRTLYNATHDALVVGNGVVYHYWDPTPDVQVADYSGLTPDAMAVLVEDENSEIVAQQQTGTAQIELPDPATGQMVPVDVPVFSVRVKHIRKRGKVCVHACKPENFYIDPDATTTDEARFAAYLHDNKTRSDLVEMGFDRAEVDELSAGTIYSDETSLARNQYAGSLRSQALKSQERIDLYECYLRADINDDGVAELLQVWYAGHHGSGRVLAWQEWGDDLPFSDIPCYPVPHQWDADSAADRTRDIQRIKTVLLRGALDNIYASNNPMLEVDTDSVKNPDILAKPKFGALIWKKPNSAPVRPVQVPFVADRAFAAMGLMDEVIAKRTGVSRMTMALDPEALQNQSATANQNARDAGYSQIELVARNMAELGWTRVFRAILRLIVKHQDRPETIRLRDKFVEMDPRAWSADMDVTINVGLGTGSRDRDMIMLDRVKADQFTLATQLADRGAAEQAVEMIPRILLTMKKSAESAGLKNPDAFYPEFGPEMVDTMKQGIAAAQQQPDPATMKAQMDQASKDAQAQRDHEYRMQQLAAKREMDVIAARDKLALDKYQVDQELLLKQWQLEKEMAMNERLGLHKQQMSNDVQVGGNPG